jgi:NDP-sugar pyrophosphorylase family protein
MKPIQDVVILCGGRGTRLREHGQSLPKPLVEIGGEPIVWHVVRIYAAHGLRRFHLCTGYRGELIEQFVAARAACIAVVVGGFLAAGAGCGGTKEAVQAGSSGGASLRRYVLPAFGELPIARLDERAIAKWITERVNN